MSVYTHYLTIQPGIGAESCPGCFCCGLFLRLVGHLSARVFFKWFHLRSLDKQAVSCNSSHDWLMSFWPWIYSCFVWYVYVKLHQWMPFDCFQCWHSCVYAALGETVVSIGNNNPAMWSCNHKEGDTRLIVHILHTLEQLLKRIEVCTIDTDVIVIFVGAFVKLQVFHKLTNYSTTSAFRGKGKIIMVSLIGSTHQSIWYTWLIS